MIVLWLSEIITEYGLGNGASLLIYTNIVSSLPNFLKQLVREGGDSAPISSWLISAFVLFMALYGIVLLQEGMRRVPLISSKQLNQTSLPVSGSSNLGSYNYIPLRFNQAGVMPIILTTAVLVIPTYIYNLGLIPIVTPIITLPVFVKSSKLLYWVSYFILVLTFSLFYSTIVVNPKDLSDELQKMAVSIPGVRPGVATTFYLKQVMKRVTLLGAIMLSFLATLPNVIEVILSLSGVTNLGTTSLLILVGVILDVTREIRSIILSNIYNEMFD
jgi:preprotein translocase subunit SecY